MCGAARARVLDAPELRVFRDGQGAERLDARCAELGWHLDFLTPGWLTEELLRVFAKMRCAFSLAHMGMFRAEAGPSQPGFRKLVDLLRHGDGRAWVKLTGTYRMATPPAFARRRTFR